MTRKPVATMGSGNVFTDLGFDNPEEMRLRADVVQELRAIIAEKGLTQTEATRLFGVRQPDLSALLRGRLTKYSLERLLTFLTALDRDVAITIKAKPPRRAARLTLAVA